MENVESYYPLSPMQQGMLFHSLFEPQTRLYVELLSFKLTGQIDVTIFHNTWQYLVDRHAILRSGFVTENVKEPVQVVFKQIKIPFDYQDWRDKDDVEQSNLLANLLINERQKGFDMTRAPLLRVSLIQIQENEFQFIWTHHHILLDGWSIPILLREFLIVYSALNFGIKPQLPEVRPFRDYIVWLKRQDMTVSESYWKKVLAGFTAPTPLVVTNIDRKELASRVEFQEFESLLTKELTSSLQLLARRNNITLNTLMQGAWALLLYKYSGEQDVLFGVTVSGRPPELPGAESMIGLFINTLPLRVNVGVDDSLMPWLKNIQLKQAEMRQYEYTPLAQIQGWSQVSRGSAIFNSIFVFENLPVGGITGGGQLDVNIEGGVSVSYTNFPLTVVAVPGDQLLIKISFDCTSFDMKTIKRMMGHIVSILTDIVSRPEQKIVQINLLTKEERRLVSEQWNTRQVSYPHQRCIHEWVERQAELTPEAIAVTYDGNSLSYQELNHLSNQLAYYLTQRGVNRESLVGLYLERSQQLLIAILGVLKAGGAYVPLDPAYPRERLAFIVDDYSSYSAEGVSGHNGRSILITQESMLPSLPETSAELVIIDADWDEIVLESADFQTQSGNLPNLSSGVQPGDLAYVIYTSGSTGKPKGVMVTHANVVRLFEATNDWYHFNQQDVWTLFHSYAFDFSVWEIWGALFYGGRVVVVPYLVSRSPEAFYQLLRSEKVTVLNQTPSAFRQLIRAEDTVDVSDDLALRYVIFGGEALELQSLKPWFSRHGDQKPQLINMYGITETTVHVTYRPITLSDLDYAPGSVIGKAIPDLEIFILDQNQEPVPIGVPGELYIGGAGVARGYLNRSELTNQRFLSKLLGETRSNRVYRSGDLARYLPDGDIEYLGRIDQQVKIRGFRVELGEIESVLVSSPEVREAVVLVNEADGIKRLIAYLIPAADGSTIHIQELRKAISGKLPDYMVPAAYISLDSFPLTTNGKIDQRALLAISVEHSQSAPDETYIAPRNPQEQKMAEIWAKLLGVERVGRDDNFFELGGDSILSIQLVSRAKQAGMNISYRHLFENPILRDLIAVIGDQKSFEEERSLVVGPVPLTPIQHWFFEHHPDAPHHFNTSIMFEIAPSINISLVKESLRHLLLHHDALRLQFDIRDGGWSQVVNGGDVDIPFLTFDLSGIEGNKQNDALKEKIRDLQTSFVLSEPPLIRIAIFNLGDERPGRLFCTFHHLIIDGVSIRIFMEDFFTVYLQLLSGQAVRLPSKTTSYLSWGNGLVEYSRTSGLQREAYFWLDLSKKFYPHLPVDILGGENTYGYTDSISATLDPETTSHLLQRLPSNFNADVNDALLTSLARTMYRWTGNRQLFVELEGHGRESVGDTVLADMDLSRTIGWFTSIFPVILDLGDSDEIRSQLAYIVDQLELIPNHGLGYGVLRYLTEDLDIRDQLSKMEIPEINFNYLGRFDQSGVELPPGSINKASREDDDRNSENVQNMPTPIRIASDDTGPEQDPASKRSALIYVVATITGNQLGIRWLFSRNIHHRETIEWLANIFLSEIKLLADLLK